MANFYYPEKDAVLEEVLAAYDFPATLLGAVRYGQGHINDTFCVLCQPQEGDCIRFILQGLSLAAFPHPEELMENFIGITSYLREIITQQGGDPMREALSLVKTRDGKDYYTDGTGKVWRLTPFIENTDCFQSATPELFEASARSFGNFQHMLQNYPAETLHETIVNFHNTPDRYAKFKAVLAEDRLGRAKNAQYEIEEFLKREADGATLMNMLQEGKLPLRVTHNDTKLNNVMLDARTRKPLCVIDLDTVMPGLLAFDFGDSIRFGAATAAEDERDLSKVSMDLELYRIFAQGFISACPQLTEAEYVSLAWGARTMTLECGLRFLTDYLDGDHYFAIHREGHNLDRCRTQLKMVQDMEGKWEQMLAIIEEIHKA